LGLQGNQEIAPKRRLAYFHFMVAELLTGQPPSPEFAELLRPEPWSSAA
jgi:hypothetical protein